MATAKKKTTPKKTTPKKTTPKKAAAPVVVKAAPKKAAAPAVVKAAPKKAAAPVVVDLPSITQTEALLLLNGLDARPGGPKTAPALPPTVVLAARQLVTEACKHMLDEQPRRRVLAALISELRAAAR